MMFLVTFATVVITTLGSEEPASELVDMVSGRAAMETCHSLIEDAEGIRREGYTAIDKADLIREQAYRVKEEAFEIKEEAFEIKEEAYEVKLSSMEARSELENSLVEAMVVIKNQATATSLYVQEIRDSLVSLNNRLDKVEQNIEEKLEEQSARVTQVGTKVEETQLTAETIKSRQQAWISEIRLISLYKVTGANNERDSSDLVVDGQFIHDKHSITGMNTYFHSGTSGTDNKIWIELGGLFMIHKVKIVNIRFCCNERLDRLVGAHLYADEKLIGTVIETKKFYEFFASEDGQLTYASEITLHQPLARLLHILELQVWGKGPFSPEDKF